jgi:DNA-binding HxlR family transcriptional regulator
MMQRNLSSRLYDATVLGNTYRGQNCSIAGALELVGERWTLLILRDAFLGTRRFDDFQRNLGVARNVLQSRLGRLVEEGVLRRERYQERPERFEYRLTRKGVDLWPVLVSLMKWGDKHAAHNGPPVIMRHIGCGGEIDDRRICTACGKHLEAHESMPELGPGALPGQDRPGAPRPAAA